MSDTIQNMQVIPLEYYIFFCSALFAIGVVGVLVKRNALVKFMLQSKAGIKIKR